MSSTLNALQAQAARALLSAGVVGFDPANPITFRSGILSPVYLDNRRLPFVPTQWRVIIDGFRQMIALDGIVFQVLAGIEAAGIPHSAALGFSLNMPSVFVRKQPKEHGTRSRIEGGDVRGQQVLLVEDLVTTGGSSLAGVEALREAGAQVTDCMCIASYDFAEARQAFNAAGVQLHTLVPFPVLVAEASDSGVFGRDALEVLETWMRDPHGWRPGLTRDEGKNQ